MNCREVHATVSIDRTVPLEPGLPLDRTACDELDRSADRLDGFDALRARFAPGAPGALYFDANSIGPMPHDAPERMRRVLDEGWRLARRRGWNDFDWLEQPRSLGAAIAPVLGAGPDDVLVADSTSVNLYKLLRTALAARAPRKVIVVERDVFPSNRYVAEGIAQAGMATLRLIDRPDDLAAALAPGDVAVVSLSHVDYRSSERLDMSVLSAQIRAGGALSLWDLSHSVGAVAIHLQADGADLATGCGYKYLSGGPGAPSFIYLNPRLRETVNSRLRETAWPALCGWMGPADTFAFDPGYRPAPDVSQFQVGTPPVLANAAFSAAAEIWRDVDAAALTARHRSLTDTLIALLDEHCEGFGLHLASSRDHARRGGHVALRFEGAAALAQALVAAGVVLSARKPDSLRFGVHPLTTTHGDLHEAVQRLQTVLQTAAWREPRFAGASV
jgi:kynureninase